MIVLSNLAALLRAFGTLRTSRLSDKNPGLLLFDGGTDSAYENYALLMPEAVDSHRCTDLLEEGFRFFERAGRPHIWPLFPGLPDETGGELAARGASLQDVFYGMTIDLRDRPLLDGTGPDGELPARIVCHGEAEAWADAVWYGFDSDEAPPDGFRRFACGASCLDGIVFAATDAPALPGVPFGFSATGMMFLGGGSAGLYYIATRPAFRQRGLAARVVLRLLQAAGDSGEQTACLLATPQGRPLYAKLGFEEVCRVPIYAVGE